MLDVSENTVYRGRFLLFIYREINKLNKHYIKTQEN